jgi:membrane protein required for colicin V production
MTVLDWIVVGYLALGLLKGFRAGFVAIALSLAGYVVAYMVARAYTPALAHLLLTRFHADRLLLGAVHVPAGLTALGLPEARTVIADAAFLALLVATEVVVLRMARALNAQNLNLPLIGGLNRLLGGVFGVGEHLAVAAVLLLVLAPVVHPEGTVVRAVLSGAGSVGRLLGGWVPPVVKSP